MKLRISEDGTIHGLWSDAVDWRAIGRVRVHRASHVEFCDRRQLWYVQVGRPRSWIRRILQQVLHRPFGEILHWAKTRQDALAWERAYFCPGGAGWRVVKHRSLMRVSMWPGRVRSI
jgi:hypothetical protein